MVKKNKGDNDVRCPCGSTHEFSRCCSRYLDDAAIPETAEQLMRSRYCAYVTQDEDYLLATWHPSTRPGRVSFDAQQRWLGLKVYATEAGGTLDFAGTVEFVARFKINGKAHRLREISRFEKIDGRWYYLDDQHL